MRTKYLYILGLVIGMHFSALGQNGNSNFVLPAVSQNQNCESDLASVNLSNENIEYIGRWDFSGQCPKVWAPGAYLRFRFKGNSCRFIIEDENLWGNHNFIELVIDNSIENRIRLSGKLDTISLPTNLDSGEHTVLICKDTEAGIGYMKIKEIHCASIMPGKLSFERKIECIGNSITCGMGSDESYKKCGTSEWYDQHNAYMAYGPRTARRLNAQWHLTSVSGIGLVHSYCGSSTEMPEVFHRTSLGIDGKNWDFDKYIPDVLTICLGQNDGIQDSTLFCNAYLNFIKLIRTYYPETQIICLTSPMGDKTLNDVLKKYINSVVERRKSEGDNKVSKYFFKNRYIRGCDTHPNIDDHALIADELEMELRKLMCW